MKLQKRNEYDVFLGELVAKIQEARLEAFRSINRDQGFDEGITIAGSDQEGSVGSRVAGSVILNIPTSVGELGLTAQEDNFSNIPTLVGELAELTFRRE